MLAFARRQVDRNTQEALVGAAAWNLAERDPDAAFALLKEYRSSDSGHFSGALERLAKRDPLKLLAQAQEFGVISRDWAEHAAAGAWAEKDFEAALAWARDHPNPSILQRVVNRGKWDDWRKRLDLIRTFDGHRQTRMASNLDHLASKDPAAFLEHVDGMASQLPENIYKGLQGAALEAAMHKDRKLLAQWINERFDPKDALRSLEFPIRTYALEDPDGAREWALSLTDPAIQASALKAVASASERLQPTRTPEDFAKKLGGGASLESRRYLLSFDETQQAALQKHIAQLPAQERDTANQAYYRVLMDAQSHAAAAKQVFQLPLTEDKRIEEVAKLSSAWAYQEPVAAAQWAASLPAGPTKEWALRNVAAQWGRSHSSAAESWARALPEGPDRQAAMTGLQ